MSDYEEYIVFCGPDMDEEGKEIVCVYYTNEHLVLQEACEPRDKNKRVFEQGLDIARKYLGVKPHAQIGGSKPTSDGFVLYIRNN